MKKLRILISILLMLILLDGLLTFMNTPDLQNEGNPLITVLGFGWEALFIVNVLVFSLVCISSYYSFIKYTSIKANIKNRREYCSYIFYGRPDKFIWGLYKLPKNWAPFFALIGYVFLYIMILNRAILVFEWLTIHNTVPVYDCVRSLMPYGRLDMVFTMIFMIILIFVWLEKEYKKSKRAQIS